MLLEIGNTCISVLTLARAGVIRQYRIRVNAQDYSGFEQVYTTSSTIQFVDRLACCSDYRFSVSAFTIAYGPAATDMAFRTNPDLSGKGTSINVP